MGPCIRFSFCEGISIKSASAPPGSDAADRRARSNPGKHRANRGWRARRDLILLATLLWVVGQVVVAGAHIWPLSKGASERRVSAVTTTRPRASSKETPRGSEPRQVAPVGTPSDDASASNDGSGSSGVGQHLPSKARGALGPAGTHQSSFPVVAYSQYVKNTAPGKLRRLGCSEGRRLERSKQGTAIVVLTFGSPMHKHGNSGASLFGARFASTTHIGRAAQAYAGGYVSCSLKESPHLHVAIGTSNYGPAVTFHHGADWARMVNQTNEWALQQHIDGRVEFAGASDIELAWNRPGPSKAWVRGYDKNAQWPFYDFGDAGGCPPRGNCVGSWTQEDVWFVSWGARSAWPLPQIYTPNGSMAQEWYRLSLYSYQRHGKRMTLVGALSQRAACRQSSDSCAGINNSPSKAWHQLNRLLNRDRRTAQPLPWISDIRWADR
jgi:hypothetical protein